MARSVFLDWIGGIPVEVDGATIIIEDAAVVIERNGIGTTSTDGLVLENTTDAAAGAQQYSPRLRLRGEGWKTDATAGSQTVDYALEVQPVQGSAAPTGNLILKASINGGAFSTVGTFSSSGSFTAANAITSGNHITLPAASSVIWSSRSLMRSTTDGTVRVLNSAESNTYDIALADWGTTLSAESNSMADAGTQNLGVKLGKLEITVGTDNIVGTFQLRGSSNAVVSDSNNDALFTTTKDNAGTINVYFDTNAYFIQNLRGGARSIRSVVIGA